MDTPIITLEDILSAAPKPFSSDDKKRISEALEFAKKAHRGQVRRSGVPYVTHTIATAHILAGIGMDASTVIAGLIHDIPEDTAVPLSEIETRFGPTVVHIVDGITKLGKIKLRGSREEYFLENLRKMFLAMAEDIRVVIVKLADRLHNMQTLDALSTDKQLRIAQETMDVYAPIANRLGIGEIKGELEDLAFKYLDPKNYALTKDISDTYLREGQADIDHIVELFQKELKEEKIRTITVSGRKKHLYRLFLKLKTHDMDIRRVYDTIAIRIIVPSIADCYEALGIVHKRYRPLVGRIKDYISLPKPNGYQSLHTSIFGPDGRILEVQIRTQKMDTEAEYGIAAHWIYTEEERKGWRDLFVKKKVETMNPTKDLTWVRQLQEWQHEIGRDDAEFLEGLKIDFFKNHIFAFTPKGDIIDLPEDATPIDFAYAIHSEIGHRATGAKVEGKMVPFDYKIKNGERVEILTTRDKKKPSHDWLSFVKTSNAKSHIRHALRKETFRA
jgi:GTP pyrophosphokinase